MAPFTASRVLLIALLILVVELSEPKVGIRTAAKSRTRFSSTRSRRTGGYTRYTTYTGGSHGRGLSWWQICLIIGGIVFGFLLLWYCIRVCKNKEPQSDTPGIESTRDCIQLRDHQMTNEFPRTNYQDEKGQGGLCDGIQQPPYPSAPYQQIPPPPSYNDALQIGKEPIDEGAVNTWDDSTNIKQFGVI